MSLGIEVAVAGAAAEAVFADFAAPSRPRQVPGIDVVLAAGSAAGARRSRVPVVTLRVVPGLEVPAYDPARFNPVGWVRDPPARVAALGDPRLLPSDTAAERRVRVSDRRALRRCHHVADVAAFHANRAARAGALVRVAAMGVPVRLADPAPELRPLLGAALHALMADGVRGAEPREREILSVRMRRLALRDHTLRARARQVCAAAGLEPLPWPCVSVVVATKRPWLLEHAVASVARQDYPRLELVLALHGDGFPEDRVQRALTSLTIPATVVRVAEGQPLGAVLRVATAAASGAYVTKMDDDDVYDAVHVRDLVTARAYSGAALVGKYADVTYLADIDRTVEIGPGDTERYAHHVTGSALLISGGDLDHVGGWRRVPSGEDVALIEDVKRAGGAVYRTHGLGIVRVRHGDGHARRATSRFYLGQARSVHPGWCPELAGMDGVRLPPGLAEGPGAGPESSAVTTTPDATWLRSE